MRRLLIGLTILTAGCASEPGSRATPTPVENPAQESSAAPAPDGASAPLSVPGRTIILTPETRKIRTH